MNADKFFEELDKLFRTKNIKEAEKYVLETMEHVQKEKDIPGLLAIANELGGIYRVTSRFDEAKKAYAAAIEAIRLLGMENTLEHGTTLLNLASVYAESNEQEAALKLYERAAEIFASAGLNSDYRMAALYNNISHVYDKQVQYDKAMEYALKSLAIIESLDGYDVERATTYTTLATQYMKRQQFDQAMDYLAKAERLFQSLPGKRNVHYAATLNAMAEIFQHRGNLSEAANYYEKTLALLKESYGENHSYEEVFRKLEKLRDPGELRKSSEESGKSPGKLGEDSGESEKVHRMKGLELSEAYYNEYGWKMIQEQFPEYRKYMAIGLVGEGSECFGFDDSLSENHDFGPGFCIWLPDEIYRKVGEPIQNAYDQLPKSYRGTTRVETPEGKGRVGVFSTAEFYKKYIGAPGVPDNNVDWLFIPETSIATVTNGKVFIDYLGEFTKIREGLLNFYPEDIFRKKLAARMAMMSQTGQYNYERCMIRKEGGAAYLSCAEFIKMTISAVYLINHRYMPFYKWTFRGMGQLEHLSDIGKMLEMLAQIPDVLENTRRKTDLIEEICIKVRDELIRQGIIDGIDPFLNNHCRQVMDRIADPRIKSLPVMFDGK